MSHLPPPRLIRPGDQVVRAVEGEGGAALPSGAVSYPIPLRIENGSSGTDAGTGNVVRLSVVLVPDDQVVRTVKSDRRPVPARVGECLVGRGQFLRESLERRTHQLRCRLESPSR